MKRSEREGGNAWKEARAECGIRTVLRLPKRCGCFANLQPDRNIAQPVKYFIRSLYILGQGTVLLTKVGHQLLTSTFLNQKFDPSPAFVPC